MSVYVVNITIPSGADFEQNFFLESNESNSPINLENYTGASFLKKSAETNSIAAQFEVSFPNNNLGQVTISLGSTATSKLKSGRYVYDILLDDGSKKTRVVEGSALVTAGITTS
jgi:hypothetical protein